ncbi:autotransporter domain-containing protein [Pseudotabrizicola algicola]|uniref:Autotransporter domain-containing protein n=1 Tax=Pseudotabrizicola algicola TaxID=2709381 RepID=A0A6B3RSU6_9RHOB|nr:autotransporter domain-containing protein [Pseudotabrizicola algicola]NEX48601.1 autotransporter domain-containing protein [Pseudotabrizicola algicola]
MVQTVGMSLGAAVTLSCMGATAFAQVLECDSAAPVGTEAYEICDLGTLDTGTRSAASGVSADGTVVIGSANTNDGMRPFRWTQSGGMQNLGVLYDDYTTARGVNADGTVVVGTSGNRAFRWVDGVGMSDIGTLAGGNTTANAVSPDGSVVVGYSTVSDLQLAYRWTETSMESLITGTHSEAFGVNSDGTVIVGHYYTGWWVAFRWVEGSGMQSLGSLGGYVRSRANAVTPDGSIVVGSAATADDSTHAFRWIANGTAGVSSNPQMEDLGTFEGGSYSDATAVNADGSVVVGYSDDGASGWAFRWVEGVGMQNLGGLTGASYSIANGVSADGSIVVGESASYGEDHYDMGTSRAFIWREAGDDGTMEDIANLTASVPILGNDSAVAQAEQQFALGQTMEQQAFVQSGQMVMSAQTNIQHTGRNPTTVGARNSSVGAISFGRGISDTVTLGATLSLSGTSLKNNAFDMDTDLGAALWGQYSAGGAARTGLQFSGAIGYMTSEGEIARGRLLTDVLLATGSSTVETRAVKASIGHGLEHGDWLITSQIGIAHYDTRREAYAETGASFNASYDEMRSSRTVATLGVTGAFDVSERGRLAIGVGVDQELNPERPRLTGTSDIPGLATFDIGGTFSPNRTRGFATVDYTHDFENGSSVTGNLRVGDAVYGTTRSVGVGVSYSMQF